MQHKADYSYYEWERYWYKRGSQLPYTKGFFNPDINKKISPKNNFFTFEEISENPCLILLGEAGLGKSRTIKKVIEELEKDLENKSDEVIYCDLGLITGEYSLDKRVFENRKFNDWINGQHQLHLFLDSLDEGLLQINVLGEILIEKLQGLDFSRLRLRVACRTGIFPISLENQLINLWGEKNVYVVQLASLSSTDVITACENLDIIGKERIKGKAFLKNVIDQQIQPFASNPITLKMLLKTAVANQKLLTTKVQLYKKGLRELCNETNKDKPIRKNVSVDKLLEIAMLLGAITIFCNKRTFSRDTFEEDKVSIDELSKLTFRSFSYGYEDIEEVLGTALFTDGQQNEYTWTHFSYAEFLATQFIKNNGFSTDQILSLILQSEDNNERVIPQLHQTSAWLASSLSPIFNEIIEKDPDVLCLSDATELNDKQRQYLVQSLLEKYDSCPEYYQHGGPAFFKNLYHNELASQLRQFINDKSRTEFSKRIAVNIAYQCELYELAEDIMNLVIEYDYYPLAEDSLYIFLQLANDKQKIHSLDLINKLSNSLAINLIRNIYPKHISINKIFDFTLKSYFSDNRINREVISLLEILSQDDLIHFLNLMHVEDKKSSKGNNVQTILDIILIYIWDYTDNEEIRKLWIEIAMERFKRLGTPIVKTDFVNNYHGNFKEKFQSDFHNRILLIKTLWRADPNLNALDITNCTLKLIQANDIRRIFLYQKKEKDLSFKIWLIKLIAHLFDPNEPKHLEICEPMYQQNNLLKSSLREIKLSSIEAERLREDYKKYSTKGIISVLLDRKLSRLQLLDSMNLLKENILEGWPQFLKQMYEEFFSLINDNEYNLRRSEGWKLLKNDEHKTIVEAAKKFLESFDNIDYKRDSYNKLSPIYDAIELIWDVEKSYIEDLPKIIWEKILDYIINTSTARYANNKAYFTLAYNYNPQKVSAFLIKEMKKRRKLGSVDGGRLIIEERIKYCMNPFFINEIINTLDNQKIRLTSRGDLFKILIEVGGDKGYSYVTNIVDKRNKSITSWKKAIEATCALMEKGSDRGNESILSLFKNNNLKDERFLIQVLRRFSKDRRDYSFFEDWKNKDLVDFYIFLHQIQKGVYKKKVPNPIAWKKIILENLEKDDNEESLSSIFKLSKLLPDCTYIQSSWEMLRIAYFRKKWLPPTIEVLFEMINHNQVKPITNGSQLLSIIEDSLQEFEKDMNTSENPLIEQLWNVYKSKEDSKKKGTIRIPKDETMLSNTLKRHLNNDLEKRGLIFNREVEVFHSQGGSSGERIDIKIDVPFNKNICMPLQAFIEVKGCWNKDLETAMEKQLVERYMKKRNCPYGLYVIGWFNCPQWSLNEDNRRMPVYSLKEARERFDKQALSLSKKYDVEVKAIVIDLSLK
ncbi:NACHT domain-containing protein [Priestia sp. D3YE.R1]|uniref:NACHT domain-containing protein n=1 Tax=Priestia sp. D3YE.R1 TaxID=3400416 RepID=UPI003BA0DAD5